MDQTQAYEIYLNNLLEIAESLNKITVSQNDIDRNERSAVSGIENSFMALSTELQEAKKTISEQYASVLDSCKRSAGLRRPNDQRPAPTERSWREAIHIQEEAASRIRDWITLKNSQAYEARQRKVREEQARKEAQAAAAEAAAKRKAEEAAEAEKRRAEAFVEALKDKHRRN